MDTTLDIFYIRHANTSGAKPDGRERDDVGLSELGERQLPLLGERFRGAHFDGVFVSPLYRCVRTAAAVLNNLADHPEAELLYELAEKSTARGTCGIGLEESRRYYDNFVPCRDRIFGDGLDAGVSFDSAEKIQGLERCRAVLSYIRSRYTYGQRVLVVAHASLGNCMLQSAVSLRDPQEGDFILSIYNTSVSKVSYAQDGRERIVFANDVSHLRSLMPNYEFEL